MVTNHEVFTKGTITSHWPCDVNELGETEINGGIEAIYEYNAIEYIVIIDHLHERTYWPHEEASRADEGSYSVDFDCEE